MRITFRFTNNEYQEFRQLNRTTATPRWKSYLLALLCLVPSFCLILGTNSLIATLAAGTLFVSVLALAIVAAIGDKPIVDKHDHILTMDQKTASESQSHSRWQTRWDYYDTFDESDRFYLLGKLDRFTAIPKRVIENTQLDQFLLLTQQVGADGESASEPERQPVPIFTELFPTENELQVYQFAYKTDDLAAAMSDRLQVVDFAGQHGSRPKSESKPKMRQRLLGTFWMSVLFFILLYIIISAPSSMPQTESWNFSQLVFLTLAIVLPFLLMKWLNRWFRGQQKRKPVRVPTEPIFMQLMPTGWAIGNHKSCQFFDWRDVESFYENKFCFGFHTFNDLVQIVPKRIFTDENEAEQFLDQAINYRREHRRSFAPTAVATETGNPYQAPIG